MKAAVLVAPRQIETQTFPIPKVGEDSALVGMIGSGICGTDKHVFVGGSGVTLGLPGDVIDLPVILGHENLGVIEEIGAKAAEAMTVDGQSLRKGERVVISADIVCGHCYYCRNIYGYPWCLNHKSYGDVLSSRNPPHLFGGYAEKMFILPGTFMFRVPHNVPDDLAVLTEQLAVAYGAFGRAFQAPNQKEGYAPADTVVIQGVGPLGLCNALMAKMLGASKIIAVDKSEYRLKLAREVCANETVSLNQYPDPKDRIDKIMRELTGGLGADLVVECTGDPHILSEGLDMLRLGGTYLVEGAYVADAGTTISPSRQILAKNARIIGASGMPYQAYARVLKMMENYQKTIPFSKVVTHRFGVESAEEAMKVSMSTESMKVVVTGGGTDNGSRSA